MSALADSVIPGSPCPRFSASGEKPLNITVIIKEVAAALSKNDALAAPALVRVTLLCFVTDPTSVWTCPGALALFEQVYAGLSDTAASGRPTDSKHFHQSQSLVLSKPSGAPCTVPTRSATLIESSRAPTTSR